MFLDVPHPIRGLKEHGKYTVSSLTEREIRELDTPFLASAMSLYNQFKIFGVLPHGKGTMDERQSVLDAIMIIEDESNAWESWEMEKSRAGRA